MNPLAWHHHTFSRTKKLAATKLHATMQATMVSYFFLLVMLSQSLRLLEKPDTGNTGTTVEHRVTCIREYCKCSGKFIQYLKNKVRWTHLTVSHDSFISVHNFHSCTQLGAGLRRDSCTHLGSYRLIRAMSTGHPYIAFLLP